MPVENSRNVTGHLQKALERGLWDQANVSANFTPWESRRRGKAKTPFCLPGCLPQRVFSDPIGVENLLIAPQRLIETGVHFCPLYPRKRTSGG